MKTSFSSRRDFLRTAAASALAMLPSGLTAAETKTPAHTFCAFEKPLQFLGFDELAELIAGMGYNGIEAAVRDHGHVLPEKVEEDLPRMAEALKKRGLEMTILTSSINSVDSPHAEKVLRTAARLGVKRYRLFWYSYDLKKPILRQLDEIRPRLKDLAALNHELGMTGLYQNHSGEKMVGSPLWDIYDLIKDLNPKDMALAYDIRHATVEGGLNWPIQFKLIQSHLGVVYVKDFTWKDHKVENVPLGEGLVQKGFFTMLKETGYKGPISVHVEYLDRSKDAKVIGQAFKNDLEKLKSWL